MFNVISGPHDGKYYVADTSRTPTRQGVYTEDGVLVRGEDMGDSAEIAFRIWAQKQDVRLSDGELREMWKGRPAPAAPKGIRIVITSQYGTLSRGRHSARKGNGAKAQWAAKDGKGRLIITEPGVWQLHCTDGFKRSARATITVDADGNCDWNGEASRFDVV